MFNSKFMKRFLFTVCLIALFFANSFAQSKMRFGVDGGLTYSSFRGNKSAEKLDAGIDFLVGVSFEYQLKSKWSLLANLSYDRITAKRSSVFIPNPEDPAVGDITAKVTYQYLTLPILLKYRIGAKQSFYAAGGVFIGYLLKSEIHEDYYNTTDNTTNLNTNLDAGLTLGLGKNFRLKNNQEITIELRENLGLTNTSKVNVSGGNSVKTNSLNLILKPKKACSKTNILLPKRWPGSTPCRATSTKPSGPMKF